MKIILFVLFIILSLSVLSQDITGNYYWIQFSDKNNSQYSLSQPNAYLSQRSIDRRKRQEILIDSTDLPVNANYVEAIKNLGFQVKHTSKWLNGCIAILPPSISISDIIFPSFVNSFELTKGTTTKSVNNKFELLSSPIDTAYYGISSKQIGIMNGHILHNFSKGEGVNIAVIDAGFSNANSIPALSSLFSNNQILGTRDFVTPGTNIYTQHYHGTAVLSIIGANYQGNLIGSAPLASFWLIRTEDDGSEYPVEADYWICAAEFADSVGCEVLNTSLGYTTFDNITLNRQYKYMNGKTYRDSRAANMAVEKGIVTVISAGNEGSNSWRYVSTPGEAEKALCVGATNENGQISWFSSQGFSVTGSPRKPNVVAMGENTAFASPSGSINIGNGTSFSSPLIAGMAACLVKLYPKLKASEIIKLIDESGNIYPSFNTSYGYGVPNFEKILIKQGTLSINNLSDSRSLIFPNPFSNSFTIFNDDNYRKLIISTLDGKIIYQKTLLNGDISIEIGAEFNLLNGVYIATLLNDNVAKTFKLIKK